MYPTLAQVLELDAMRRGRPRVVAGAAGLGRQVRWTHVAELPDIAHLLRGDELLLSTAVAFPDDVDDVAAMVRRLAEAGVAGLVVELGRRYRDALPGAVVEAAADAGLPLVELHREISFVQVTEAVHSLVVEGQLVELRVSDQVHRAFTELMIEGASPDAIVRQTAQMANTPVVLENLNHQVMAFDAAGSSADQLLDRWESRSRTAGASGHHEGGPSWVVAPVGARGTDWGRLVLVVDGPVTSRHRVLADRAAAALALGRLVDREQESLERQSHRALLAAIVEQSATSHDLLLRARGLGVPLEGKTLVAVVMRPRDLTHTPLTDQARLGRLAETAAEALRGVRALGLVGVLDDATVGLLLVVGDRSRTDSVLATISDRTARGVAAAGDQEVLVAAGSTVEDVLQVRRSFLEAAQVADLAGGAGHAPSRPFHRLADVGLRGLLHLLREDVRLQTYVERQLGPLLERDADRGTHLTDVLGAYLDAGTNKSAAAAALGVSRPAFYERLDAVEDALGVDLDDVDTCLTLHVALAALSAIRSTG